MQIDHNDSTMVQYSTMSTIEYEHDLHVEALWHEGQQKKALSEFSSEELRPAFEHEPGICSCMDEGVAEGDIRGSWILDPNGIDGAVEKLRDQGITKVTAHENCGAAAMAYRRDHPNEHEIDPERVNQYAADWFRQLADRLDADYEYIPSGSMSRPEHFHDARAVYVVLSEQRFQPAMVPELPKGFVVTGNVLKPEEIVRDVELATSLALGAAGFGDKFSIDDPFSIVVVGEMDTVVQQKIDELITLHAGRVKLDELPVPAETKREA